MEAACVLAFAQVPVEQESILVQRPIEPHSSRVRVRAAIHDSRAVSAKDDRRERQAEFVDKIRVDECSVERRATFEKDHVCSGLTQLLQRCGEVDAASPCAHEIGDRFEYLASLVGSIRRRDDDRSSFWVEHAMCRLDLEAASHDGNTGKGGLAARQSTFLDLEGSLRSPVVLGDCGSRRHDDHVGHGSHGAENAFVCGSAETPGDTVHRNPSIDARDHVAHDPWSIRQGNSLIGGVDNLGVDVIHRAGEDLVHTGQRYRRECADHRPPGVAKLWKTPAKSTRYSQLVLFSPTGPAPYCEERSGWLWASARWRPHVQQVFGLFLEGGSESEHLDPGVSVTRCQRV